MQVEALAKLVEALSAAESFESAAGPALRALLDVTGEELARSRHAEDGRLLRALVHLRPADGYRGLVVLGARETAASHAEGDEFLISSGAWRTIVQRDCAVAIDVATGTLRAVGPDGTSPLLAAEREAASDRTLSRLKRRGATHVYVLPLRGAGGVPVGMFSVEAECPTAAGQRFVWQEVHRALSFVADLAAPHLAHLPLRGDEAERADPFLPIVGSSMAPLVRLLRVFARQDETLLVTGATGTGKSRIARWCHEQSPRREGPFEVVDLLSVPEEIQVGELFGWRKGAFTGASSDHQGFVQRAEGGTLFIDEIDKLSSRAQAALLYLLEERRFRILGDGAERRCDVRFVVGTNADLRRAVSEGRFREDLYYRVNVLAVALPPLSERRDEIVPWAGYMLERRHKDMGEAGAVSLEPEAARLLEAAPWPGNLRQLDNVVRRAYVLALAERAEARGDLQVGEAHVRESLLAEGTPGSAIPVNPLRELAARFVTEAARRGGGLDLDLLTGLRGLALAEAVRQTGSKAEAFKLLGRESLVKGRNHHKALQRELARAADLCRALGIAVEEQDWPSEGSDD